MPSTRTALIAAIALTFGIGTACAQDFNNPPTAALKVSDGVTTLPTILDNGVGDSNSNTGEIDFSGGLNGWFTNVDTGLSKLIIGSPSDPQMDLSFNVAYLLLHSVAGDGTLTLKFSDTGFLPSPTGFTGELGGTLSGGIGSVTVYDYAGPSNGLFDTSDLLCTMSFTSSPFGSSCNGTYTGSSPFSLTEVVVITNPNRAVGQASGDHSLTAPEPGTLLLLGGAMAALGFMRRRVGS